MSAQTGGRTKPSLRPLPRFRGERERPKERARAAQLAQCRQQPQPQCEQRASSPRGSPANAGSAAAQAASAARKRAQFRRLQQRGSARDFARGSAATRAACCRPSVAPCSNGALRARQAQQQARAHVWRVAQRGAAHGLASLYCTPICAWSAREAGSRGACPSSPRQHAKGTKLLVNCGGHLARPLLERVRVARARAGGAARARCPTGGSRLAC